jgi:hypothetical protein
MIGAIGELSYISSYQTLSGDKKWKSNQASMKLNKKLGAYMHRRGKAVNSLTAKSVPTGKKNSRAEGFLLAKHKHTNIPTMMGPFPPPAAWF